MKAGFDFSFPNRAAIQRAAPDQPGADASCVLFSEERWEDYAMCRIAEDECAALEEHLLICPRCQNVLARVDEYLEVAETASALASDSFAARSRLRDPAIRMRLTKPVGAAAAAASFLLWLR